MRRVQGRAAGDEDDAIHRAEFGGREVQSAQTRRAFFVADAAAEGVFDGARLLEDFLEHEMRELAALGFLGGEFDFADLRADGCRLDRGHLEIVAGQRDDFEVVEVNDAAGVRDDGADVAGEEILVASDAEQQRAAAAGADDHVGMIGVNDGDAVGADHVFEGAAHGFGQCRAILCACGRPDRVSGCHVLKFLVIIADEVGEDFGVGLRDEFVAFGEQAFFELLMVFDDAVVDERDFAGLIEVRMRVLVGRQAVGRPAGVADAGRALGGLLAQERGQIVDAAGLLAKLELAVVQNAKPGGIVTAIFETAQAFEDDVGGGLRTDVADDATHRFSLFLKSRHGDSTGPVLRVIGGDGESQWRGLRCVCVCSADGDERNPGFDFCQLTQSALAG